MNSNWEIFPSWFSSISLKAENTKVRYVVVIHMGQHCRPVFTRTSWLATSALLSFIKRKRSRTIFWSSWVKKQQKRSINIHLDQARNQLRYQTPSKNEVWPKSIPCLLIKLWPFSRISWQSRGFRNIWEGHLP